MTTLKQAVTNALVESGWTKDQVAAVRIPSQPCEPMIQGSRCPVLEIDLPPAVEDDWRKRRRWLDLAGIRLDGVHFEAGCWFSDDGQKLNAGQPLADDWDGDEDVIISGAPTVYIPKFYR